MVGISNVLSFEDEVNETKRIFENFDRRIMQTGRIPGTHSLGREFANKPLLEEKPVSAIADLLEVILPVELAKFADVAREDIKNRTFKNIRRMMQEG